MWTGIQITATMTAVVRGSMALPQRSGPAAATAGTGSVMAGLIVGMAVGTGIRAVSLPIFDTAEEPLASQLQLGHAHFKAVAGMASSRLQLFYQRSDLQGLRNT